MQTENNYTVQNIKINSKLSKFVNLLLISSEPKNFIKRKLFFVTKSIEVKQSCKISVLIDFWQQQSFFSFRVAIIQFYLAKINQ